MSGFRTESQKRRKEKRRKEKKREEKKIEERSRSKKNRRVKAATATKIFTDIAFFTEKC